MNVFNINSLMIHHLADVENILACIRIYAEAVESGEKSRKNWIKNMGDDKRKNSKYGTKEEFLKEFIKRYDDAIKYGAHGIYTHSWKYFAPEHTQAIKDIRACRLDVEQSMLNLVKSITEKWINRQNEGIKNKEAADNG